MPKSGWATCIWLWVSALGVGSGCRLWVSALGVAAFLIAGAHAAADGVSARHYAFDWTFVPATANGQVIGVLGWANSDVVVAGNMNVAWFERRADGGWDSWGWTDGQVGEAAAYVTQSVNSLVKFRDHEVDERSVVSQATTPQPVTDGMFSDDPVREFVMMLPDPAGAIEAFAQAGWSLGPTLSASLVVPVEVCATPMNATIVVMNTFAQRFEMVLMGQSATELDCELFCAGCTETYSNPVPSGAGTWTLHTRVHLGWRYCRWCRPASYTLSYTGLTFWLCNSCSATTTVQGYEVCEDRILTSDTCPATPPAGCETFYSSIECPGW